MQPQKLTPPDGATNPQECIELTRDIIPDPRNTYALRIKDNTLVDVQIIVNDLVTLRRVPPALVNIGDLVHVYIRSQDRYGLMRWTGDTAAYEVQGRVIAVIRRLDTTPQMGDSVPQAPKVAPSPPPPAWQRTGQPQGTQRILEDGVTHATGAAGERVTRKRGRGVSALGRE